MMLKPLKELLNVELPIAPFTMGLVLKRMEEAGGVPAISHHHGASVVFMSPEAYRDLVELVAKLEANQTSDQGSPESEQ